MAQTSSSSNRELPVAIVSPQYCCPSPVDLVMNKSSSFGEDFSVTDVNGRSIFTVKQTLLIWLHGNKKTIIDAAGKPVVTLRPKGTSLHGRWKVFRGESTEARDLLFNVNRHSIFQWRTTLDVFLANNTAKTVCDFKLKANLSKKSCTIYAGDEGSTEIVAQMQKKRTAIFFARDKLMVTVSPNIDYAFIVALIVILEDIGSSSD